MRTFRGASALQVWSSRRPVRTLGTLLLLTVVVLLTRAYVVTSYTVESPSMAPSYETGDVVVVERVTGLWRDPQRGDVVVIRMDGELLMKRVVALGGETVSVQDAYLHVGGHAVHEPYVDHEAVDGSFSRTVVVPPGSVFVMGDSRDFSIDSRDYGAVDVGDIEGRVVAAVG